MLSSTDQNNVVTMHTRNNQLIEKHEGKFVKLKDLPKESQLAMIHYMAVDGAAWHEDFKGWEWGEGTPYETELRKQMLDDLETFLPKFIKKYGNEEFGTVNIPNQELIDTIKQDEFVDDEYIAECVLTHWEYETPTWPVILSCFDDETLQDGWTRFWRYVAKQAETVTCLYYKQ